MMSKIWYSAHIYPLTEQFAKQINKIIFQYIWGGRYEPIKRNIVFRTKSEGGLGIINCFLKAKTLLVNTSLKCYTTSDYNNSLMKYYCYVRLNNIIPINYSIHDASPITTPYYEAAITTVRSILHLRGFPFVPKDKIYRSMFTKEESLAELHYPTFNWQKVRSNYLNIFILSYDKEVIYKYLHICLATNKKLYTMNLINTGNCNKCTSNREETQLHMFYECDYVKPFLLWVLRCLLHLCNFKPSSNIRFTFFDNSYRNTYQRDICNLFIYMYIITIWRTRKENLRIGDLKYIFIRRLTDYRNFIKHIPNQKHEKLADKLSTLDIEVLDNL